jgi:hypothetical protein
MTPIKQMTREQINVAISKLAPDVCYSDPRIFQATVYAAAIVVGINADTIASFLKEPRAAVRRVVATFKSEGVFVGQSITEPKADDPEFWGKLQAKFMLAGDAYQPQNKQASV